MKRVKKSSRQKVAQANQKVHVLSEEERYLVREGLAELNRGETAIEAEVRAVFDKYRH